MNCIYMDLIFSFARKLLSDVSYFLSFPGISELNRFIGPLTVSCSKYKPTSISILLEILAYTTLGAMLSEKLEPSLRCGS